MLLAFARLLILSTSLDIDDVNVVLLCSSQLLFQQEEEEHKENDDEFFDDDDAKNEELLLEIVLKGRDFKEEEERAETPLNIYYISFRRALFLCARCSSVWTKNAIEYLFRVLKMCEKERKNFHSRNKKKRQSWKKQTKRRRIIMVAASPSLTTNALARMLEERPDPSAFQPVLQIAGNCFVYVFFIIKRYSCFLFFFFERIDSFFARERSNFWIQKNRARFNFWCFSALLFRLLTHHRSFSLTCRHPQD